MASPFQTASLQLDYPLYALDFHPDDPNRLVIGGGGGASRTGVGNKITIVETVSQNELRIAGEVELSRDEDSVMSLAIGPSKGKTTHVYAGVNSSPDSIAKGKNEHLRTLVIEKHNSKSAAIVKDHDTDITEVSRTALFTNPEADTYQRLLRVSGSRGVAATAMGKEKQLAMFEATGPNPKPKGVLELPNEAEDLDIIDKGDNEYQVAFCYKYELHLVNVGKETQEPELVYTIDPDADERPAFRLIRYMTPNFIMAVANMPKRSGIILYGIRLPGPGNERARLAITARIPRKISATALAVANLSPPASAKDPIGETQILVAVAGHDSSVSLYTTEHQTATSIDLLVKFHPLCTLNSVHGNDNITGLAFSTFVTPKTHNRPQFVKLASISLQKCVSIHSIPLKKHVDRAPRNKKGPPRAVRYVTAMEARGPSPRPVIIALTIIVLIMSIVGQTIRELYGQSTPVLHAHKWAPSWYGTLRDPQHPPAAFLANEFISKLIGEKTPLAGETLVIREGDSLPPSTVGAGSESGEPGEAAKEIIIDVHDTAVHGPGKTWEELGEEQKEAWKARLKEAGAWTQGMGESVFKGILFGELAGAVGRAVGG